jgi:hypothetical protein
VSTFVIEIDGHASSPTTEPAADQQHQLGIPHPG